jgi:chemotaxis protein methyltransferase CheR
MSLRQLGTWDEKEAPSSVGVAEARLSEPDFARLRDLLREHAGFSFDEGKSALLEARLRRRLLALGLTDFGAYLGVLDSPTGAREILHLVDAVATNVTRFFREPDHFAFAAAAARRLAAEGRRLHFWSAGCATGEEPYSLAMALNETLPAGTDWRILATDISTLALQKAQQGNYTASQVEAVPRRYRESAFSIRTGPQGEIRRIDDDLKRMILFRRLNLGRTPYPVRGVFDLVLCRNVMIYLDPQQREDAVAEFHRLLPPGGHLIVGEAENLLGVDGRFERSQPAVYRRV